jgi:thymidylate synthase (FAD)
MQELKRYHILKINSYNNIQVELLRATSDPLEILALAVDITQKKELIKRQISSKTIKAIIKMNHGSVFEHLVYTFIIKGASRSFLAQMTRHRIASYTSGSQHYQDYSQYGASVDSLLVTNKDMKEGITQAMEAYKRMLASGVPAQEARQVLPNAMQNNLLITINARSLMNMLNLRLCNRNTQEIQIVAYKIRALVIKHCSDLWSNIGPDCFMTKCIQGQISCGKKWVP